MCEDDTRTSETTETLLQKKKTETNKTNTKINLFNLSKERRTMTGLPQTHEQVREVIKATEHF